jgi:hypothetical protein
LATQSAIPRHTHALTHSTNKSIQLLLLVGAGSLKVNLEASNWPFCSKSNALAVDVSEGEREGVEGGLLLFGEAAAA